jgi:hypothetical protein
MMLNDVDPMSRLRIVQLVVRLTVLLPDDVLFQCCLISVKLAVHLVAQLINDG